MALKSINQRPIDYTHLYAKEMAMLAKGYSEDMFATAFDHLCANKKATRDFWRRMLSFESFGWMVTFLLSSDDFGWC